MSKDWIPNRNQEYYYIDSDMTVHKTINEHDMFDADRMDANNCFMNKECAEDIAREFRDILANTDKVTFWGRGKCRKK